VIPLILLTSDEARGRSRQLQTQKAIDWLIATALVGVNGALLVMLFFP
jgi:hypothetical protein